MDPLLLSPLSDWKSSVTRRARLRVSKSACLPSAEACSLDRSNSGCCGSPSSLPSPSLAACVQNQGGKRRVGCWGPHRHRRPWRTACSIIRGGHRLPVLIAIAVHGGLCAASGKGGTKSHGSALTGRPLLSLLIAVAALGGWAEVQNAWMA